MNETPTPRLVPDRPSDAAIRWIKRLFCRHSGGINFVRNIYGDEIIVANARSVWQCKRCGGYVYMPGLGNEGPNHD